MVTPLSVPGALDGETHVICRASNVNDNLAVANEVVAEDACLRLIADHVFELAKLSSLYLDVGHDRESLFIMVTRVRNNI
jgi:hypothetical protein